MKKMLVLAIIWLMMMGIIVCSWPLIHEAACASRMSDAPGGEMLLWLVPTMAVVCLMPCGKEEKLNRKR